MVHPDELDPRRAQRLEVLDHLEPALSEGESDALSTQVLRPPGCRLHPPTPQLAALGIDSTPGASSPRSTVTA